MKSWWLVGCALIAFTAAEAKIPSAEFVFQKVANKEKNRSLRIKSKINNDGEIFLETLSVDFHRGVASLQLKTPDDQWLATKFIKISQSKTLPFYLLFESNVLTLRAKLLELGFFIPVDRTPETKEGSELKRLNKKYAWLFTSEDKKNSVWIEKDLFIPIRVESYRYDKVVDVEYTDQRPSGGLMIPRKTQVRLNGTPTFQVELQEVAVSVDAIDVGDTSSKTSNDLTRAAQDWLKWMRE